MKKTQFALAGFEDEDEDDHEPKTWAAFRSWKRQKKNPQKNHK